MRKFLLLVALLWVGFGVLVAWRNRPVPVELEEVGATHCYTARFCCGGRRNVYRVRFGPVERGLGWLARHQQSDGRWSALDFAACCTRTRCEGINPRCDDVRATSLALGTFFAAGYQPQSSSTFGRCIARGARWLKEQQKDDGSFGPRDAVSVARHIAATETIVGVYSSTYAVFFWLPARKAMRFLGASRAEDGGWGFAPRAPRSDASITARALGVLRAGAAAGLEIDDETAALGLVALPALPEPHEAPPSRQETRLRGCADGSWSGPRGRLVETALALLDLEHAPH